MAVFRGCLRGGVVGWVFAVVGDKDRRDGYYLIRCSVHPAIIFVACPVPRYSVIPSLCSMSHNSCHLSSASLRSLTMSRSTLSRVTNR